MITAEELYQIYHYETNLAKGRTVRKVQNFDNAKSKETWNSFELCASFINRNKGHINPRLYIKAIAEWKNGWFEPKLLSSQKSIKIYKEWLKESKTQSNPEFIKEEIYRSIKYIAYFCKENNLKDLSEYLSHDMFLIPSLAKHYYAGSISIYFLCCISNISILLHNYPSDVLNDYFKDFFDEYEKMRMRVININKLKGVRENIFILIEKMIKQSQ